MSDEREQPDSDGLDALASGLQANESDEPEEDLDLAGLAAVVGARPGIKPAESLAHQASSASAPAPPAPAGGPAGGRNALIPALLVLAIGVGVGGYFLGRSARPPDRPEAARATASAPSEAPRAAAEPAPPPDAAADTRPTPVEASPIAAPVLQPEPASDPRRRAAVRAAEPTAKPAAVAPSVSAPVAAPAEPAAPEELVEKPSAATTALAKAESPANRSMDELLDDALAPAEQRRASQAAAAAVLPEAPTRDEVTQAMSVLLPAIRGCAMGQTGLATAGIVVRGDGRVASVELTGAPFEGTASGRCMEGVLRRARFSRFRQATFRVRFPFAIQ